MLANFKRLGIFQQSIVAGVIFGAIYSFYMYYTQSFDVVDSVITALIFICAYLLTSIFILRKKIRSIK